MGFAADSGYTPASFEQIMSDLRISVNTVFGLSYTTETFLGSGYYKFLYGPAQRIQAGEITTSEVFQKLQDYIEVTNARISRPVNTNPGIIDKLAEPTDLEPDGYIASIKAPNNTDKGKIFLCVDTDEAADDYAAKKLEICTIIKDSTTAGCPTQGTEVETIAISNGQSFDFKFALPDRKEPDLKLTITTSENNQVVIKTQNEIKELLMANIAAKYRLGRNFEPQRYFSVVDAPWAESVLLEYDIGSGFVSTVFDAEFDDLFVIDLANISVVEL